MAKKGRRTSKIKRQKSYKPGQKAPHSGQYEIVGPRGGRTGKERTVVRGEPMPPTPKSGMVYIISDLTKHKGSVAHKKGRISSRIRKKSGGGHGTGGGVDD